MGANYLAHYCSLRGYEDSIREAKLCSSNVVFNNQGTRKVIFSGMVTKWPFMFVSCSSLKGGRSGYEFLGHCSPYHFLLLRIFG